ncbi:D-glycero-beta-D-manno-heptose-7-phosphate kinase [candidate division KSB1 bacterium]
MKLIDKNRLDILFDNAKGKRIAVIGDIMLDRYLWGKVTRISPEAPVPVVLIEEESERLGGAANVANNIESLGGIPVLFGVTGADSSGDTIKKLIEKRTYFSKGIIVDKSRSTSVKTRVIAHNQHVVRTDRETNEDIDKNIEENLKILLKEKIKDIDAVIIEDYNKGVLTKELTKYIIDLANEENKIITVDPKMSNFYEYKNVTVFKPNLKETRESLGFTIDTDDRLEIAGKMLLDRLECKYVLITRGEKGMSLFGEGKKIKDVETKALDVHDVSGAGDTVIGTLTLLLAAGADIKEAVTLANYAAGIVCSEVGIVVIEIDKLRKAVLNQT